jgi:protocatechuate 3,4-dioxygenase beta subunit
MMNRFETGSPTLVMRAGSLLRSFGVLVSILALSLTALAQVERGSITGTVTDSKGAAIPDATVRVVEESTNQTVTMQTDSAGEYKAGNLTPGSYTVQVDKAGFYLPGEQRLHHSGFSNRKARRRLECRNRQ